MKAWTLASAAGQAGAPVLNAGKQRKINSMQSHCKKEVVHPLLTHYCLCCLDFCHLDTIIWEEGTSTEELLPLD